MRGALTRCILAIVCLFFTSHLFSFQNSVRITEQEMHAVILEKEIAVTVPVWSSLGESISGELNIELLDPSDAVLTSSKSISKLKPGKTPVTMHLSRENKTKSDKILWYRLRYALRDKDKPLSQGIVALGAIAPGMFELRIAHAENAIPGKPYHVRVHASNPITHKPVAGVQIRGSLSFDSDNASANLVKMTNSSGDAILRFQIPHDLNDGGSVTIEAQNGDQTEKEEFDFDLDPRS
jgi:hypothetical protein